MRLLPRDAAPACPPCYAARSRSNWQIASARRRCRRRASTGCSPLLAAPSLALLPRTVSSRAAAQPRLRHVRLLSSHKKAAPGAAGAMTSTARSWAWLSPSPISLSSRWWAPWTRCGSAGWAVLALAGQAPGQCFFSTYFLIAFIPTITAPLVAAAAGSSDIESACKRACERSSSPAWAS